jgi:hypothetical protein
MRTSVCPSTAMEIAANPSAVHFRTHSLKAVPPPPCTSTTPGSLPSAGRVSGRPSQANTRVGLPRYGTLSKNNGRSAPSAANPSAGCRAGTAVCRPSAATSARNAA